MEIISIIITIIALIATVVFGYLQIIVPFVRKEVRLSKKFPFVETTDIPTKRRRKKKKKTGRGWLIPITAVVVLVIAVILLQVLFLQAAELHPKPIAVMTFKNLTGNENYDYLCEAIPNLLITNLEQSKHLQVMTWERMHDLLKVIGKEDLELIDEKTGFELCQMDDINTIIIGSFTKAGEIFVTEVKVLDVSSKKLLKTASSQGEGVASILKIQVDDLCRDIAKNVSLYERTVAPTEMQIMEVTTTSLDAYNYFLRGREEYENFYRSDAIKFLEKAIEIDSTFASAYYYLAMAHLWLKDSKISNKAFEKAKVFAYKATEKERLYIEADYACDIEEDYEEYYRILKQLARKYPKEKRVHLYLGWYFKKKELYYKAIEELKIALELDPNYGPTLNLLGYRYAEIGDYAKAIECFERYASVSPGDANPFDSMGDLYFRMGHLDEALIKYKEAIFIKPDFWGSSLKIAYIHALREDYTEAMKWVDHCINVAPSSGLRASGYWYKAFYTYFLGNFRQALNILDTTEDLIEPIEWKFGMAVIDWLRAWVYHDMRKYELSQNYLKDCYADLPDIQYNTVECNFSQGLIELKQEHLDLVKVALATIKSSLSNIELGHKDHALLCHNLLYAELLVAQDSLEEAIVVFKKTSKIEVEEWPSLNIDIIDKILATLNIMFNTDVAARAYLKTGEIDQAVLEYEKLIDLDPNKRGRILIRPLWRYRLAKLYEEKGINSKAIEQYGKFLDIWKDADDELPEPHDARKRLAKLKTN